MNLDVLNDRAASEKSPRRWSVLTRVGILGIVGLAALGVWQFQANRVEEAPTQVSIAPKILTVTALGRLEPQGEIINLTASTSTQESRIDRLLVKEGDRVGAGQTIAILDNRSRLQAALAQAEVDVRVAEARLEQVKAGAKSGDIAAQAATIDRFKAQRQGDEAAQIATINRLQAQWDTERAAQVATLDRIKAQREGDKAAQIATLSRLNAELKNAAAEYQRYRQLSEAGAISRSLFDSKTLSVETSRQQVAEAQANLQRIEGTAKEQVVEAQAHLNRIDSTSRQQINEAQANLERIQKTGTAQISEATSKLDSIAEVRPVDVQVAQAEVDRAMAAVTKAQTDIKQIYVKAPIAGQILKIHTRAGETIAQKGIAALGQTQQMMVVAEVYQSDITKIAVGQSATITSPAIPDSLQGRVDRIGLEVQQQQVVNEDPAANIDAKVVEVHIRLDAASSEKVAGLTNLQVTVKIEI
ncbi:MAG: efflux RND transporter periplasmic adaptor subunit [Microcoleus sp.]|uniref:efflux RND transporter periplasmic adaptor subunit n=1 Tax=Microcoleus sp. TaxID=44472 RepID=UPI003C78B70D